MDLFEWFGRKDDKYVIEIMKMNKTLFPSDFINWLPNNLHIFGEFCSRAKKLVKMGRTHYGAKTIIEVIRYHTDVKQKASEPFKINNSYTSYLVRLCEIVYPECNGLFEKRVTKKVLYEQRTIQAMNDLEIT